MTVQQPIPPPPAGFLPAEGRPTFTTHNGPLFHRLPEGEAGGVEHALYILPRHTNTLGVLHGGMLSSFLDGLLAGAVKRASGRTAVTVHLSVDFLRMARKGEWLIGEGLATRVAREVAFAEARAFVGRSEVGRATGVFKLMDR